MSPEDGEIRAWLTERFDRSDDKIDRLAKELRDEIVNTRHQQKAAIEQLAIQAAASMVELQAIKQQVHEIDQWRADEGPLDTRLKRHSRRDDEQEAWRNRMVGGLAIVAFLFPTTVGVIVALLKP